MRKLNLIFILTIILFCNSCSKDKIWKDDELSIQRVDYNGTELKTNGYYYRKLDNYYTVYFFYNNGVILYGGTFPDTELVKHEEMYLSVSWNENIKKAKYNWGVFNIVENSIKFENWYPSEPPLVTAINEGIIINDTTFIIKSFYRMLDGKKTDIRYLNEEYNFKPFPNKPDSTNSFVK